MLESMASGMTTEGFLVDYPDLQAIVKKLK